MRQQKSAVYVHEEVQESTYLPAASSNAGVCRALREVDRGSENCLKLEHVKGHQDRKKKLKWLPLKAQLNVAVHLPFVTANGQVADGHTVQSVSRTRSLLRTQVLRRGRRPI